MATANSDSDVVEADLEVIQFNVSGNTYAIDVADCNSIIEPKRTTRVPRASDAVDGVTDYRGEVAVIVDLVKVLDLSEESDAEQIKERIIILNDDADNQTVGIRVDQVVGVEEYSSENLKSSTEVGRDTDIDSDTIRGVIPLSDERDEDDVEVVQFLDIDKVLEQVREESRIEVQQTK